MYVGMHMYMHVCASRVHAAGSRSHHLQTLTHLLYSLTLLTYLRTCLAPRAASETRGDHSRADDFDAAPLVSK